MIIELCGLPGVGKTTLVRQLGDLPGCNRVMVTSKKEIIFYYLLGFFVSPIIFIKGAILCFKKFGSAFNIWNNHVYRFARYEKARRTKEGVCVLDEGPMQSFYFYGSEVEGQAVSDLIRKFPKVDKTVVLSLDESERQRRIVKRVEQNPDRIEQTSNAIGEDKMIKSNEKLIRFAAQRPDFHVLNSDDNVYTEFVKYYVSS